MKTLSILFASLLLFVNTAKADWGSDIEKAKKEAAASGKMILVSFSGSDWCIPCIKMKKDIFESAAFSEYASKNLVLVRADFPRLKKNKLSKEQTKANQALAGQYNTAGLFPFTVLIDAKGKLIKSWDGLPKDDAATFVKQVQTASGVK
jgi:thioredoxin-related protein